jgi:hypothetical protein
VTAAEFSRTGRFVVTSCDDGFLRIWSITETNTPEIQWFANAPVRRATFSPGKKNDILFMAGKSAFFWRQDDGKPTVLFGPPDAKGPGPVHAIFSPDGETAAVATTDGKVALWKLSVQNPSSQRPTVLQSQQRGRILRLAWSTKDVLAAAGEDGTVQLWHRPASATEFFEKFQAHQGPVWWLSFSPNGDQLVTTSAFSTENLPSPTSDLATEVRMLSHLPDNAARIWQISSR